jgi:hypothetical protein
MWPPSFLHQRLRELVEGVGDHHHLPERAQPLQELPCPEIGLDRVGHGLQLGKLDLARACGRHAAVHQLGEVAEVAGGERQIGQVEVLPQDRPDLGGQHTFQIEGEDHDASESSTRGRPARAAAHPPQDLQAGNRTRTLFGTPTE